MQNVTQIMGNSSFTFEKWVCTGTRVHLALDVTFLYIFIALAVIGSILMLYKFLKNRTLHNSEDKTDDGSDEESDDNKGETNE